MLLGGGAGRSIGHYTGEDRAVRRQTRHPQSPQTQTPTRTVDAPLDGLGGHADDAPHVLVGARLVVVDGREEERGAADARGAAPRLDPVALHGGDEAEGHIGDLIQWGWVEVVCGG